MNIYTLHKEGSFRPPTLDCDSEIENSQSGREKLPRPALGVVTEEKNNTSTSDTSGTSSSGHSSSLGEKTTPRHNVTPTHNVQNHVANNLANNVANTSRVAASRIDATGVITGTNMPQLLSSKAALNNEATSKPMTMRQVNYGSSQLRKSRRTNGLIHIQARDEFMIFEDNTDLVSHITTPSAVRTSPLDGDYLVIDHDEFAEEEDLFSAITVPKALRKKKNKKKPKPKTGSPSQKENNINEVQKSENDEKSSKGTVEGEPKLAPPPTPFSVPYDESEELEQEERQEIPSPLISPLKLRRQDGLDCSPNGSQNSWSSRRSSLRGGRRIDQSGKVSTPPSRISEEKRQEEESPSSKAFDIEDLVEVKKKLDDHQEQFPISPPSVKRTTPAASPASQSRASSKASPSIKGETNCITPEKSQPSPKEDMALVDENHKSPVRKSIKSPTNSTSTPRRNNSRVVGGGATVNAVRDTVAPEAATHGIDATAKTNIDSTATTEKEGSNSNNSSDEVLDKSLKVPNSRRKGKANLLKFCLLTSHCCPQRRKKQESEEP